MTLQVFGRLVGEDGRVLLIPRQRRQRCTEVLTGGLLKAAAANPCSSAGLQPRLGHAALVATAAVKRMAPGCSTAVLGTLRERRNAEEAPIDTHMRLP